MLARRGVTMDAGSAPTGLARFILRAKSAHRPARQGDRKSRALLLGKQTKSSAAPGDDRRRLFGSLSTIALRKLTSNPISDAAFKHVER
jgi:hypothetical protein